MHIDQLKQCCDAIFYDSKRAYNISILSDEGSILSHFLQYIILSSQALKDLLNQWRDLIKKSPPVVVLAIVNNEIILEPRYDVDLSA